MDCYIIFSDQKQCTNCNKLLNNTKIINKLKKFYKVKLFKVDSEHVRDKLINKNFTKLPILNIKDKNNENEKIIVGLNDILFHVENIDKNNPIYKYTTLNKIKNENLNIFDIFITDIPISNEFLNEIFKDYDLLYVKDYQIEYLKLIIPKLFFNNKILIISERKKLKKYIKALYDAFILNTDPETIIKKYKIKNNLKTLFIK